MDKKTKKIFSRNKMKLLKSNRKSQLSNSMCLWSHLIICCENSKHLSTAVDTGNKIIGNFDKIKFIKFVLVDV